MHWIDRNGMLGSVSGKKSQKSAMGNYLQFNSRV